MGEESSTEKEIKQIPTVNKVSAMIDDKLKSIMIDNSKNINEEYYCIIRKLEKPEVIKGYTGIEARAPGYIIQPDCVYAHYTNYKLRLYIVQSGNVLPRVQLRVGDKIIKEYTSETGDEYYADGEWGFLESYKIGDATNIYQNFAYIDLSQLELSGIKIDDEVKVWVEQNEIFYETLILPLQKKITSMTRTGGDCIMSLYAFRNLIYPEGSIYMSYNNIDPGIFIGGTWISITSPIENAYFWKRTA